MKPPLRSAVSVNRVSLTLATIVVVVGLLVAQVSILDMIELRTYDLRFLSRGPLQPSPAVVLAMIDEKSLDTVGRWPWPRAKLAAVVDLVSRDGAKVIAFDIGFLEPDERDELELLERVEQTIGGLGLAHPKLDAFFAQTRQRADNDQALARAIRESPAVVVLGYFFHMSKSDLNYEIDQAEIDRQLELIASSKYPLVIYRTVKTDGLVLPKAYAPEGSIPLLAAAADSSGHFNVQQDTDGVVRRMPLVIQSGEKLFPPLSILMAWHYLDRPQLMVRVGTHGVDGIQMGERSIPADEEGHLLINYIGPPKTVPHVSISDVLGGRVPAGTFRDRIVLVGTSATGISDVRSTPFSPAYPGGEIHATVVDNILTRNYITKPSWAKITDVLAIVLLAALAGIALPHLRPLPGLLFTGATFALYIVVTRELFVRFGVWLNVVYPLLALAGSYTALTAHSYVTEQRDRRKIRNAFGHYVAPVVIEQMLKDPARLKLGGEQKVLTVLFSDLQGFTSYSERYSPQEMIQLLSEYYARMTEQIFAREGMLKEYVGDELMAIFGAPIEHADHAARACAAALEMRAHRAAMREEWVRNGRPPLLARTGINSGPMLVGNLGSQYRFSYGVLGDHVNLGSRLEGLNKEYGTEILIGENTAELVAQCFVLREIDMVRVMGRTSPTRIYELVAAAGTSLPVEQGDALRHYAAALEAYRAQRWRDAIGLFEEALTRWPGEGPSLVMIRRCRIFAEAPPPGDWDGIFEATRK